jgi:hypothetical protein
MSARLMECRRMAGDELHDQGTIHVKVIVATDACLRGDAREAAMTAFAKSWRCE